MNGNLVWYSGGDNPGDTGQPIELYLRGLVDSTSAFPPYTPTDAVEVAGDIKFAGGATQILLYPLILNNGAYVDQAPDGIPLFYSDKAPDSSNKNGFSVQSGFYRDGSDEGDYSLDSNGNLSPLPRGVKRIEAPLVDQPDVTNTTTRYRLLTLNSSGRTQINGRWVNLASYGWGRGIYIGNTNDVQNESETLVGGYTLRSDWLNPNNQMSTYWKGPYYVPPGVIIELEPNDYETINGVRRYYFKITRTDALTNGQQAVWYDCTGLARPDWGGTVRMPYPDPVNGRMLTSAVGGSDTNPGHIDGNGVIFAEGNIRIKGMLPPGMRLTVVSNQNIYIEGNVLKNRPSDYDQSTQDDQWHGADPTCGLALLARENICVNTTQFFAPDNSITSDDIGSDAQNGEPPFHVIVDNSPASRLRFALSFGPWESESASATLPNAESANAKDQYMLFLRHAGQYGATYINAWLNPGVSGVLNGGLLGLKHLYATVFPPFIFGVGDARFPPLTAAGWGADSSFVCWTFPLTADIDASLNVTPGFRIFFRLRLTRTHIRETTISWAGSPSNPWTFA